MNIHYSRIWKTSHKTQKTVKGINVEGITSKFNVLRLWIGMTGGRRYSRLAFRRYSLEVIPARRKWWQPKMIKFKMAASINFEFFKVRIFFQMEVFLWRNFQFPKKMNSTLFFAIWSFPIFTNSPMHGHAWDVTFYMDHARDRMGPQYGSFYKLVRSTFVTIPVCILQHSL